MHISVGARLTTLPVNRLVDTPDGFGELYDLTSDPWEMPNLCFDSQYGPVVSKLERDLLDWIVVTTRPSTILPAINYTSPQAHTRYRNTVNADGRFNPGHIRDLVK